MDVLMLSRLQFAFATIVHFIFVPLTLGLSVLVAIMETRYVKTGDETYKRMAKFWGKLFLINFALGIVTGITLEFQFGTNWSRYSAYVGDVFGSLLAVEATVAFFLESTFIGVWVFGWEKLSPKMHATAIWLVAGASTVSAFWILQANAWMQHPVGYVLRNGRAELTDFFAVISQDLGWSSFFHTVSAAYVLAGLFVMAVSCWHLLRGNDAAFFKKSFGLASVFALLFALVVVVQGHMHGAEVAKYQPAKLAAMESHWNTKKNAPQYIFAIPDPENERNSVEILPIPGGLSMLAYHDPNAEVKGLKDFPKADRPPVTLTFVMFRLMIGLGFFFLALLGYAWLKRGTIEQNPQFMRFLLWCLPLPYLAIQAGWAVTEVGRQPWIVYGVMRTADAVSPIAVSQAAVSLVAFFLMYALLAGLDIFLLAKFARKGPQSAPAPAGR
ncbi:MAG: cytochrome ubiquinol oxidase subunit I [Desulfovibrionaceae bacterium]|nr:cytochrome ubiquinol oxidase subunit I [Desulfovibrionaceae bacterium]MBF0514579.1 cytochrome ubiquinol oxidase subunit I [Desulfovibrionaceae bacterium]